MTLPTFGQLLADYMTRSGISDSELARSIGVRRQTIFRWKEGLVERPRSREDVLQCAKKLRLSAEERDRLLLAAGFAPEQLSPTVLPSTTSVATMPPSEIPSPHPAPLVNAEAFAADLADDQDNAPEPATHLDTRTSLLVASFDSSPIVDVPVDDRPLMPGSSPLTPLSKPLDEAVAPATEVLPVPEAAMKPAPSPLPPL